MTAGYHRVFANPDVVQVYKLIGDVILSMERANAHARRLRLPPPYTVARVKMLKLAERQRTSLNRLGKLTAAEATTNIKARIDATQIRTSTGKTPHLRSLIFCKPLIADTGAVGIARLSTLNRAVNPLTPGYGPYWRAQEYGTGAPAPGGAIPTQVGRIIRGYFYGAGGQGAGTVPLSSFKGGGGPHPVFIPSSVRSGAKGGKGGPGEISVDIRGRFFLRDGADEALVRWHAGMRHIERDASRDLASALTSVRVAPAHRRR